MFLDTDGGAGLKFYVPIGSKAKYEVAGCEYWLEYVVPEDIIEKDFTNEANLLPKITLFRTLSKKNPNIHLSNIKSTQDSISFEIDIIDPDNVGELTSIELYNQGELVESLIDLPLRIFDNLESNTEYEIRVVYTYNLNDGFGARDYIIDNVKENILERIFLHDYGFIIENNEIIGNGINSETILFIDMPVGDYAFSRELKIEHLIFGPNVTYIGERAFFEAWDLKTVTFLSEEPPLIGNDVFGGVWNGRLMLYVPFGTREEYHNAGDIYWKDYIHPHDEIIEIDFYNQYDFSLHMKFIKTSVLNGKGTLENPYKIYTIEEFNCINVLKAEGKEYVYSLQNNLDFSDSEFTVIEEFKGTFLGNSFKLENISITASQSSQASYGVFLNLYGTVENLIIKSLQTNIESQKKSVVFGGLTAYNYGDIKGVLLDGIIEIDIISGSANVGGLVGINKGTIIESSTTVEMIVKGSSETRVGGIVGEFSGDLLQTYSVNDIIASSVFARTYVGGLAGYIKTGNIENSYAYTYISSTTDVHIGVSGGGIAGSVKSYGESEIVVIANTYSYGKIDTGSLAGGIIGEIWNSYSSHIDVENSFSFAEIHSAGPGGIIGDLRLDTESTARIDNNYRFENQIIIRFGELAEPMDKYIETASIEQFDSEEFYIDVLNWNQDIWSLIELNSIDNKFPILR